MFPFSNMFAENMATTIPVSDIITSTASEQTDEFITSATFTTDFDKQNGLYTRV